MKRVLIFLVCLSLTVLAIWGGTTKLLPVISFSTASDPIVVLDAGHGGEDGGAVSAAGNRESDVNLEIVLKLEALMAFCGVETRLTRETDISLHAPGAENSGSRKQSDLEYRANLVESIPNSMLISVHQNHFTSPAISGAQVFYSQGDVGRQWGELTQDALRLVLDPGNRRTAKQVSESIYLFQHVSGPALLIECGFLSNGEEASLLLTDSYQRRIAVAVTGAYLQEIQSISATLGGNYGQK